jgi:hypothetical protein
MQRNFSNVQGQGYSYKSGAKVIFWVREVKTKNTKKNRFLLKLKSNYVPKNLGKFLKG